MVFIVRRLIRRRPIFRFHYTEATIDDKGLARDVATLWIRQEGRKIRDLFYASPYGAKGWYQESTSASSGISGNHFVAI